MNTSLTYIYVSYTNEDENLDSSGRPKPTLHHIGVIDVTPTEFSSKEIIQTPTLLQLVWFPPHKIFRIYNHSKLNWGAPQ